MALVIEHRKLLLRCYHIKSSKLIRLIASFQTMTSKYLLRTMSQYRDSLAMYIKPPLPDVRCLFTLFNVPSSELKSGAR